jgi:hypothetical protein
LNANVIVWIVELNAKINAKTIDAFLVILVVINAYVVNYPTPKGIGLQVS